MGFFKELWKNQPNTIMGFGALLILIGFFNAVRLNKPQNMVNPPGAVNKEILEKRNATPKTFRLTAQEVVD